MLETSSLEIATNLHRSASRQAVFLSYSAIARARLPERILSDRTSQVGSHRWRFTVARVSEQDGINQIRVFLDGKGVQTKSGEFEYGAVAMKWPFDGQLLAVSEHTSYGHGMKTWLYCADRHGLMNLRIELKGEIGGPFYRDFDGDGRPEIVFDNYNWYEHFDGSSPTLFYVYKYDGKRMRLWRKLPNRKHRRLPYQLPYI